MSQATGPVRRAVILPAFCPTSPHSGHGPGSTRTTRSAYIPAEQRGSGSGGWTRTHLDESHQLKPQGRRFDPYLPIAPPQVSAAADNQAAACQPVIGRDGPTGPTMACKGQGLEVPLASGSRRAATERRRKQHDRWKSVTDRQITGRWQVRSPVAFSPSSTILNRATYWPRGARWI
jgi:hypothetical protein